MDIGGGNGPVFRDDDMKGKRCNWKGDDEFAVQAPRAPEGLDFVFVNVIMTRLILRLEYLKLSHNDRIGYEQRTKPEIELHVVSKGN